ncbi:MAG: preprotein translocase subunit SecE [Phycisphaerales bacterium]|nr:preprotein translocase subunit SecE [Phycisphaerales bacterium]
MSFGIYKQGQGYWIRVMTAAFVGVLIISAAAWGWGQAGTVRLPARAWTITINNVQGNVNVGDTVELLGFDEESTDPEGLVVIGAATVDEYSPGRGSTGTLVISNFSNDDIRDRANDSTTVRSEPIDNPTLTATVRGSTPTTVFPIQYLQSGVAGGVMLLGALLLYLFIGSKKSTVEFLIATDGEMKKVNWTTYREVKGSTIVVIVATFLIAGFLFVIDLGFSNFFRMIGVLES